MMEVGTRKLEEEESVKAFERSCRDRESDEESGEEYDSDDQVMYADGRRMCIRLRREYYRQIKESEGFEMTLDLELGVPIGAPIIPQRTKENIPLFTDLSRLAIATFNSHNGTNYEFVKNEIVNTSYASGMWCFITFQAKDATSTTAAADDLKTFQAKAWWGIKGDTDVIFCRFKKTDQGDTRPSDPDVNVKATQ